MGAKSLGLLAFPREAREASYINDLAEVWGQAPPIDFQDIPVGRPKPPRINSANLARAF
jgi:hypothetical protein